MSYAYYLVKKDDEAAKRLAKKLRDAKKNQIVELLEDEWRAFLGDVNSMGQPIPRIVTATKKTDGE